MHRGHFFSCVCVFGCSSRFFRVGVSCLVLFVLVVHKFMKPSPEIVLPLSFVFVLQLSAKCPKKKDERGIYTRDREMEEWETR
jgi:hypothetical protein